jgi:choline dehydrogenase-like flavoprotein
VRWAVVGAGSAGCVVAARLSERAGDEITLYEAGPDLTPADAAALGGPDAMAAANAPGRTVADLVARRVPGGSPLPYQRGRGVGGSSVVNAMVALRGDPAQYERWGWTDVEAAWQRVQLPAEPAAPEEIGPLSRALLEADPQAGVLPLTRRHGRRVTSAEAYLWEAMDRPNLTVRTDVEVTAVQLDGGRARGLQLGSGVAGGFAAADAVVLCAGAIHTPELLLRSGVDVPGVGEHLQDHPSVAITVELADAGRRSEDELAVSTVLDAGPWQVLPIDSAADGSGRYGLLLCAVMQPTGRGGTVRLGERSVEVDLHLLADPGDRRLLRQAVRGALDLLEHRAFADLVVGAYADEHGTPAGGLRDDDVFERWLPTAAGGYVHASATCAMGVVVDADGRLRGHEGLFVCDASVFPEVPHVHPHLPVTMLAERLVARWGRTAAR